MDDLEPTPEVRRYVCTESAAQLCPQLRPGTAAKGKVEFGDQTGVRRLKAGDLLTVLAHLSPEAFIATPKGAAPDTEVLILTRYTQPL